MPILFSCYVANQLLILYQLITNDLLMQFLCTIITNHSIGNFLPIDSQCFTNHQFTNGTGNLQITANGLPLVPIGDYIREMLL